jgi:hypothetical protein
LKDSAPEIIDTLNREIGALVEPRGATAGLPENFDKLITAESKKWAKVIQFAGSKLQ